MKTNGINQDFNVEDYENLNANDNTTAKRVAAGAAILAGGAIIGGGAAYAATRPGEEDKNMLSTDDVLNGAEAGSEETAETAEETVNERVVYVEARPEEPKTVEPEEPSVTWDDTTNVYVDGELVSSVEEGTYEGHHFQLKDIDGDGKADVLGLDLNNNGVYEANEKVYYTESDNIRMGHATSETSNHYFYTSETGEVIEDPGYTAENEGQIHNNFEDEKTGENYRGDYAENNPDYNPHADIDYSEKQYLAENDHYDEENSNYSAEMDYDTAEAETYEEEEQVEDCYTAEADDDTSYDEMMSGEEFLG